MQITTIMEEKKKAKHVESRFKTKPSQAPSKHRAKHSKDHPNKIDRSEAKRDFKIYSKQTKSKWQGKANNGGTRVRRTFRTFERAEKLRAITRAVATAVVAGGVCP